MTNITEQASRFDHLDKMSVREILVNINKEDETVHLAVHKVIPQIEKLIEAEYAPFKEKLERIIGRTKTMMYRRATYENPMDNFITDAYRDMFNTDVAFAPAWRFGLTILPGDITVEDVYAMISTNEHAITFTLNGSNIKFILEAALENVVVENPYEQLGGDLIRFSGMEIVADESKPFGKRVVSLKIGGKPYDPKQKYTIVTANSSLYK